MMKIMRAAGSVILWLHLLPLFLDAIHASPLQPLQINQTTSPLTLTIPSALEIPLNLTQVDPIPHKYVLPTSKVTPPSPLTPRRQAWPYLPITRTSPVNMQWLSVETGGIFFPPEEGESVRWVISLLLLRLESLPENDACPPYSRFMHNYYVELEVLRPPPTVAQCKWAIKTFDGLLEVYGVRESKSLFGLMKDRSRERGKFVIWLEAPLQGALGSS